MFYNSVRYLSPGAATQMVMIESLIYIVAFIFMHMFVFEELAAYLIRYAAFSGWYGMAETIRGFFDLIMHSRGTDLGSSTWQAIFVWLITTPIWLTIRRLQNIIATR